MPGFAEVGRPSDIIDVFACRLIAILHDGVTHDCPLDYASLTHLGPIVPTLKGRRIVGSTPGLASSSIVL